jgi:hypothetical protein
MTENVVFCMDFAALTRSDSFRNFLAYQVLPFHGVGVDELLEGQPNVCKRALYDPYFRGSSMSAMFTGSRWLNVCLSELYDWLGYERGKKGDQNMLQIQTFEFE